MKLYYAPGACSLADHIALLEVGERFEIEAVDIFAKRTASGADFHDVNPKGYVPALVLDDGQVLTENIAVLDWIAERHRQLQPSGTMGRTRQLEMLAFISTEIHRAFKPLWHKGSEPEKQKARETVADLLQFTATQMHGDYLFGDRLSAADCYLFVMLRWAARFGITAPDPLRLLQGLMEERPSVQSALESEGTPVRRPALQEPAVRENPEQHRFEWPIHDGSMAAAYYSVDGGRVVFTHTETPTEFSGLGIATALSRGALDLLRASGRKAVLKCSFMNHFLATHPEYADVVVG